jgi:hypothetical protein
MNNLNIALVHYPVLNKLGEIVTTSVTPFDIHDISRSGLTFGVRSFYIVNPSQKQKEVLDRISKFWSSGIGKEYNETRSQAFEITKFAYSIDEVKQNLINEYNGNIKLVATTAKDIKSDKSISIDELRGIKNTTPLLILFGTGWGLTPDIISNCDYIMKPIKGISDYNHLSVRSAVSIILYLINNQI